MNKFKHCVCGEEFDLEVSDNKIYLSHPKWSFVGEGDNLIEAEMDVVRQAREIASEFIVMRDTGFTYEALKLREFILRVIGE
jgi:hypothetical protein